VIKLFNNQVHNSDIDVHVLEATSGADSSGINNVNVFCMVRMSLPLNLTVFYQELANVTMHLQTLTNMH